MAASMITRSRSCVKNIYKWSGIHLAGRRHASNTKAISTQVSVHEEERNLSIEGREVPVIPLEIYPPGQWGDMEPEVAWAWANDAKAIVKYKQYRSVTKKIKLLTQKNYKTWKFPAINMEPRSFDYQCGVSKTFKLYGLPELYETVGELDEEEFEQVKAVIIDFLELDNQMNRSRARKMFGKKRSNMDFLTEDFWPYTQSRIKFESLLTNILCAVNGHDGLKDFSLDKDVAVAACFNRHGVKRGKVLPAAYTSTLQKLRQQNNSSFQGEHVIDFQIRKQNRLPQFVDLDDNLCVGEYPTVHSQYKPKHLGQFQEHCQRKITAGFTWQRPFNPHVFTHLSIGFLNNNKLAYLGKQYDNETREEATEGYALMTGFLSTLAQAYTQGFNEYQEITYPLTSQTILTDGRQFKFSCYQLNTMQLFKSDDVNPFRNLFWSTNTESLYESFDDSGKVVGFDNEVLRTLLKFLLIPPGSPGKYKADNLMIRPKSKKKEKIEKEIVYDQTA